MIREVTPVARLDWDSPGKRLYHVPFTLDGTWGRARVPLGVVCGPRPGPTIVANGAVWTVATDNGDLVALDESSGRPLTSQHFGPVPSRFTSPAAGGGRVVVAAGRVVMAFGD